MMCLSDLNGGFIIVLRWLGTEGASKLAIVEGLRTWFFCLLDEWLCAIGATGTQDALARPINVGTREVAIPGERTQAR